MRKTEILGIQAFEPLTSSQVDEKGQAYWQRMTSFQNLSYYLS